MKEISRLKELYMHQSKHSNYQILPKKLSKYLGNKPLLIHSRHEESRLRFITDVIKIKGKSVLDVGGNTGYFSLELLDQGANSVAFYEGNKEHAEFVKLSADLLGFNNRITVVNEYLDFSDTNSISKKYDVALVMNVLHHLGDDYGNTSIQVEEAKNLIKKSLKQMALISSILVFQIGYCWKGDRNSPLFTNGTKVEQIEFVNQATSGYWEIMSIGIPQLKGEKVDYEEPLEENLKRRDDLGEFLNRPLFVLKNIQG